MSPPSRLRLALALGLAAVLLPAAGAGDAPATITGQARVGATLTCGAPPFSEAPGELLHRWVSYRFRRGNLVRQQSPAPTYVVRPEDANRTVFCLAVAWTPGGVGQSRASPGLRIAG